MKYQAKHDIVKELPKEFREIADSAIDHIGSIVENMKVGDILEGGAAVYCGYVGYNAIGIEGLGLALLGYQLATTPSYGGIGASQVAGISLLVALGIIGNPNMKVAIAADREKIEEIKKDVSLTEEQKRLQTLDLIKARMQEWSSP